MRTRLFLAAAFLMCPVVGGADVASDLFSYKEIVRQYRTGDEAGAVRSIASWSGPRLLKTAPQLWQRTQPERVGDPDLSAIFAACLLHLEVLVRHPGPPVVEAIHQQVLREHLARLRRLKDRPPLIADLHLGLALHMQGQLELEDLQLFFEEIGGAYASHGAFLLAEGTLHEVLASHRLEGARRAILVPGAKRSLEKAERLLRQALAVAPDLAEARLRLAHVVVQQGRPDAGLDLLQPALLDSSHSDRRYLAFLFAGRAHVHAGRLGLAEQAFAAAAAEGPCGRAAAIALAHVAFRERRLDSVREVLRNSLKRGDGCIDPWASYDFGQAAGLEGLITDLRRRLPS